LATVVGQWTNGTDTGRANMMAHAREIFARRLNPHRTDQTLDQARMRALEPQLARIHREIQPFLPVRGALQHAIATHGRTPEGRARIVAAIQGNDALAATLGLSGLRRLVQYGNETFGRNQSGAAISQSEWEGFRSLLGQGSVLNGPEDVVDALSTLIDVGESNLTALGVGGYADEFRRQIRLSMEEQ